MSIGQVVGLVACTPVHSQLKKTYIPYRIPCVLLSEFVTVSSFVASQLVCDTEYCTVIIAVIARRAVRDSLAEQQPDNGKWQKLADWCLIRSHRPPPPTTNRRVDKFSTLSECCSSSSLCATYVMCIFQVLKGFMTATTTTTTMRTTTFP